MFGQPDGSKDYGGSAGFTREPGRSTHPFILANGPDPTILVEPPFEEFRQVKQFPDLDRLDEQTVFQAITGPPEGTRSRWNNG